MSNTPHDVGFRFPEWETRITAQDQQAKLACCEIEPDIFAGYLDITALATQSILATKKAGYSINGMVHMAQRFIQYEPIQVGQRLIATGEVIDVHRAPRGDIIVSEFIYRRDDGSISCRTNKVSLRLDTAGKTGAADKIKPAEAQIGGTLLKEWQLIPELVAEHSREADNLIHCDPKVARAFGFRAPIAGGLMAVHHMTAALAKTGVVRELDMEVRFRRPMFWDDKLRLFAGLSDNQIIQGLAFTGPEGKLVNDCSVKTVRYV